MWVPLALACRLKRDRPLDLAAHSTRPTANAPRTAPSMPSDPGVVKRVALRHSLPFCPLRLFYAKPGPARRPLDAADSHDLGLGLRRPARRVCCRFIATAPEPVLARGKARDTRLFSTSMCFTPPGLARKNAPGVFVVVPNERRETQHRAKTGPALRVARKISPCVVVGLGKGTTITGVLRLAWRDFSRQRGLR